MLRVRKTPVSDGFGCSETAQSKDNEQLQGRHDDSDWDKIFPIDDRLGRYALTHTKITTLMLSTEVEVMTFLPHIERIVELCPGLKRLHIHHYDNWSAGPFQPCVDLCGKRSDFQSDGRWRMRIPL